MKFVDMPRRWLLNLNLKLFAMNSRNNLLPNIWCICKSHLDPVILDSDSQQVSFSIKVNDKTVAFSVVYASTNYITRRQLWNKLNDLQTLHNLPWSFIGDFNAIIGAHEHRGSFNPARLPMTEFQNWAESFNLVHLPTRGAEFTWSNGRRSGRCTERRLDRVLCNNLFLDLCNSIYVSTLIKHKSDHYPLLFELQTSNVTFASQFKFMRMWTLHPGCKQVVQDCWNSNIIGCPMFVLSRKLKLLKENLKTWNKNCFGNVHEFVTSAEQNLHLIQEQIQTIGPSEDLLNAELLAHKSYEDALNRQEAFWQEKAHLSWHLEGDRNTKFFHRIAKIKSTTKNITTLQDGEHVLTDQNQISDHVVNFYKNLFSTNIVFY
ncbi:hypothetical protein P8452_08606 [Trifolium repens]|nr:hypothetical protein P8452_08606 [Trifolium repens]